MREASRKESRRKAGRDRESKWSNNILRLPGILVSSRYCLNGGRYYDDNDSIPAKPEAVGVFK